MLTTLTRPAAVPWAPSKAWSAWILGLTLALAVCTIDSTPARAGAIGETAENFAKKLTDDPTAQKEIGEAVETLLESAPDAREIAKKGPGVKGGPKPISGPFQDLVVNFDKMACAAWIISFRDTLLGLMLKRDPETPPQTLAAAQNLLNKVVFACRKVLDPDTEYGVGGGGGGGQAGGEQSGEGAGTTGPGVDVVDGELISSASDWICWNRCADKWAEWKNALSMRQRAEYRHRSARDRADDLERNWLPHAEARLARIERDYTAMDKTTPESNFAGADLSNQRTEVERLRGEARAARQEAEALQQALDGLRQAEQAALQAYLDCLKACAGQARDANVPSTFAEAVIGKFTPLLRISLAPTRTRIVPVPESAENRTARLEGIGALRTGQAAMSGTEVSLALPYRRDLGGQTRAEASRAMDQAWDQHFGHRDDYAQPVETPAEPSFVPPPLEPLGDSAPLVEYIEAHPPAEFIESQPATEFYCPDHPGMGPHSH